MLSTCLAKQLTSCLGIIMTVVAGGHRAGERQNPLMSPSLPASEYMHFSLCWDIHTTDMRQSFSEWLWERILLAVKDKWVATIPESFQKPWGCRKIFKGGRWLGRWGWQGLHTQDSRDNGSEEWVAAAARCRLCWNKAAGEGHRESTLQALREGWGRIKPLAGRRQPHLPFSINQPTIEGPALKQSRVSLPPSHAASFQTSDHSWTSENSSSFLKPRAVVQKFIFIIELVFLLLPSPQISLGLVSQPRVFHIFQITQKSVCAAWSRFKEQSEISFWISSYLYFVLLFLVTEEKQWHKESTGNTALSSTNVSGSDFQTNSHIVRSTRVSLRKSVQWLLTGFNTLGTV